jgi:hypothetical protein
MVGAGLTPDSTIPDRYKAHCQTSMKYLKISAYELIAIVLIVAATIMRLVFTGQGGPLTNSDEDTIGVMALHIAYHGEHPIFFYGQYYMGAFEAYVAAVFFRLFGPSLFSLRLGLVLMFTGFLASTYLLTRWLYTRTWALVVLLILGLGSSYTLARELSTIGGYPETLLFGSLSCLLACWLVLTYNRELPLSKRLWRFPVYACWGLLAGLGLWSDLLIIPFVFMPGLLLLAVCWRELLQVVATVCILLGLLVGAYPLIRYNLHAAPGQDSLTILRGLRGSSSSYLELANLIKELKGTVQVSIPMMTGNPFCPVTELPFLGPNSPRSLQCTVLHSIWGFGYLFIFAIAFCLIGWALWRLWRRRRESGSTPELRQEVVRQMARLMLLGAGLLALLSYAISAAPLDWPGIHGRYIIGLLIVTPAILWPIWSAMQASRERVGKFTPALRLGGAIVLLVVCAVLATGNVLAFMELPGIQTSNQADAALIHDLERLGVKHMYTDYWTCNKIAFVSDEKVICGVVGGSLAPSHNRTPGYYDTVSSDPHSAYAFPVASGYNTPAGSNRVLAVENHLQQKGMKYQRYVLDGYIIYVPEG